ncbi:putative neutral sphingomyelinase [Eurytemora carolleeae]|uniref:putative neutral sphingomyelinase n=1 Tax=Eurytemora carolleeae TaxID=1294199 RepID=UPI000C78ACB8|nr:putative neutral sphingomyelinase [Eurytemora carolleeae]|eukprot:XP_023336100.1 putative neutral sphingomyelinase [Eurytemora affinis]
MLRLCWSLTVIHLLLLQLIYPSRIHQSASNPASQPRFHPSSHPASNPASYRSQPSTQVRHTVPNLTHIKSDRLVQDVGVKENLIVDTYKQTQGEWLVQKNISAPYPEVGGVGGGGGTLLKVLNLNLWGLGWPLGEDKDLRFMAIREELVAGNYDIVMLQELWYRADYDILRATMPYVSQYDSINSGCTSFILPLGCSGLTVLSKYPIVDVRLIPFNHRGNFWRFDGEIFVRKGLGIARILYLDKTIDVFTTHLVSYTKADDNKLVRYMQATETVNLISKSDADITLFGGDINATPIDNMHQPYGMLRTVLKDAMVDKYPGSSFHPLFATFGNSENTYTRHYKPERIDYLMYRSIDSISMKTVEFTMPIMLTRAADGRIISVSDHEPLSATFLIHDYRNHTQARTLN